MLTPKTTIAAAPNPEPPLLDAATHRDWPFGLLEPYSYDFLMVDPPWPFETYSAKGKRKSASAQYQTMALDEIAALPVAQLARRDAVIMLWITTPMLFVPDEPGLSPAGRVLQAWGFRYGSVGGWAKKTRNGRTRWGTGYWMRSGMELFILGFTGQPRHSLGALNLIEGVARQHSRKPVAAYDWAERYMPGKRYCELFSRESRDGWDSWGLEAGTFDEEEADATK